MLGRVMYYLTAVVLALLLSFLEFPGFNGDLFTGADCWIQTYQD